MANRNFLFALFFIILAQLGFSQDPGAIISRLQIRGATETGGSTNYYRFLPRLDSNGLLNVSMFPTNVIVSTNNSVFANAITNVVSSGINTSLITTSANHMAVLKSLSSGANISFNANGTNIQIYMPANISVTTLSAVNIAQMGVNYTNTCQGHFIFRKGIDIYGSNIVNVGNAVRVGDAVNLGQLQASTNGLATVAYVDVATNGLVTASITNGLASTSYVDAATNGLAKTSYVDLATNGLVTASVTNGLAGTNWVISNFLPPAATNGIDVSTRTLTGDWTITSSLNVPTLNVVTVTNTQLFTTNANLSGHMNAGGFNITNLLAGTQADHAVNLAQLIGATNGLATAAYVDLCTNGLVTASITNGLATVAYVDLCTNGLVTASVTNGLATAAYVDLCTNGLVTASVTNGLASSAYVDLCTNDLVTAAITNGLATISYVDLCTNGLASIVYVDLCTNGLVTSSVTNGLASVEYVNGCTNNLAPASTWAQFPATQSVDMAYYPVSNALHWVGGIDKASVPQTNSIQIGTFDPYQRMQFWMRGSNSVFRMGALGQDGDPWAADGSSVTTTEGMILYGARADGTLNYTNWMYLRVKPDRIGFNQCWDNTQNYIFRIDGYNFYFKPDNSSSKSFEFYRTNGNLKISGIYTGSGAGLTNTPLSALSQSSAVSGQLIGWSGSAWAPTTVTPSGYGELFLYGTTNTVTVTDAGTYYPLSGFSAGLTNQAFEATSSSLVYKLTGGRAICRASLGLTLTSSNSANVTFGLRKNGTLLTNILGSAKIGTNSGLLTAQGLLIVTNGDVLTWGATSSTAGDTLNAEQGNFNVQVVGLE